MGDRRSWEGAPKRDVSINFQEKSGGRAKKPQKIYDFWRSSTWNEKN